MVAVESSGSNAMHSEMDRRGGTGAWITATGSFPLSITISAPARTRASSEVAGGFRFRDVDHMVSHAAIIPLFTVFRFRL
jgi:hypothetical protein